MTGTGKAVAHGAVTIINAISCGLGSALGVDLHSEAIVKLTNDPKHIEGHVLSDPKESPILIKKTVRRVLEYYQVQDIYGAYVETKANIPIARGLKSSSAAANAITVATITALGETIDDLSAINLGVDAALDAGVTITGAFDDAAASYFGNIVITDNVERCLLKRLCPDEIYPVLIHVPLDKAYTSNSNVGRMKIIGKQVRILHQLTLAEEYWTAMTLNGLIYSAVLGYDIQPAIDALDVGALAAGLSGTGPAIATIVHKENIDKIRNIWEKYGGEIVETRINAEKAHQVV